MDAEVNWGAAFLDLVTLSSAPVNAPSIGLLVQISGTSPIAGRHFLGGYEGLAGSGSIVRPVFGITTGAILTDLFTRSIDVFSLVS